MEMISDFKVDFSKESHLILPFYTLPESAKVFREGASIFVIFNSFLYAISDEKEVDISSFIDDMDIKHFIYPSSVNRERRYLMKREKAEGTLSFLDSNLSEKLSEFYEEKTPFSVDKEYLDKRRDYGELFFVCKMEEKITSAAYTVKGNRQIVSLATDRAFKNQNLASSILNEISTPYLFCLTEELRTFYEKRGYKVVRIYNMINR
ncbi:MAG: hypothetical protein K6G51_00660 [Sphaerochaetaceae bacterium]|nr:hypothetical protein [Sphaerochaetaceae bacterium]